MSIKIKMQPEAAENTGLQYACNTVLLGDTAWVRSISVSGQYTTSGGLVQGVIYSPDKLHSNDESRRGKEEEKCK